LLNYTKLYALWCTAILNVHTRWCAHSEVPTLYVTYKLTFEYSTAEALRFIIFIAYISSHIYLLLLLLPPPPPRLLHLHLYWEELIRLLKYFTVSISYTFWIQAQNVMICTFTVFIIVESESAEELNINQFWIKCSNTKEICLQRRNRMPLIDYQEY